MAGKTHSYAVDVEWAGNQGWGTASFTGYKRDHVTSAAGKPDILGSSDPAFQGDPTRWNPEGSLVSSSATCHKMWYLHLCYDAGIVVSAYIDRVTGQMFEKSDDSGQFNWGHLAPTVTRAAGGNAALAKELHGRVGRLCFSARSVLFPIKHSATIIVEG